MTLVMFRSYAALDTFAKATADCRGAHNRLFRDGSMNDRRFEGAVFADVEKPKSEGPVIV